MPGLTSTTFTPQQNVPVVSDRSITLDMYLNNPLRVQRDVRALAADYFLSDRIFGPGGTATGGAVLYDQVLAADTNVFTTRDVQAINPGQEFPLLDTELVELPLVARTVKWGGAIQFTYEDIDRNRLDKLATGMTRLRNTITRKVDTVAMAVLRAAPVVTIAASTVWSDPAAPIHKDIATALATVDGFDLGYQITAGIVNHLTELDMTLNDKLIDLIAKANGELRSPLVSRNLNGVLGINWFATPRQARNEVFLIAERVAGKISDEKPLYTRVVDQPEKERKLVMGARLTVPYITEPKAVIRLTGTA